METKVIPIDWWPQDRQLVCIQACGLAEPFTKEPLHPALADVIGYGGAAGGGKTDTLLQTGIIGAIKYPKLNIGYFRREFPQLEGVGGAIQRSHEMLGHFAKYNEQKHRWTFPNGSILQFCHCKDPNDVYNYQSQQFDILLVDEVTQFTREMVKYLLTRNRATVDFSTFKPFALFGTNPGNVGHGYFKSEFVDIGEPEVVHDFLNELGETERHLFIPSKLHDNAILVKRDPGYEKRVGNTQLNKKILLEGSWDVFAGQAFAELTREVHLIKPFDIPPHWRIFCAYDHGFNHPFSFGTFAVDEDGNVYLTKRISGRLMRPDEIARVVDHVAAGIHRYPPVFAGHDCWSTQRDGGPTIAEQFLNTTPKVVLQKANIDRVQGATQVRQFLAWKNTMLNAEGKEVDGKPRFYIFEDADGIAVYNCLTEMIFDPNRPEDVLKRDADENGKGGDDDYDMVRYGLMSRPRPLPLNPVPPRPNSVLAHVLKKQQERDMEGEYVGY